MVCIRKNMPVINKKRTKKFSMREYGSITDEDEADDCDDIEMGSQKGRDYRNSYRNHKYIDKTECRNCRGVCICLSTTGSGKSRPK